MKSKLATILILLATSTVSKVSLNERLKNGKIICAEGYLFEMEKRGYLQAGPFVPEVVLEHPETVRQFHVEFARAGSDVIEAFTYYAHRDKLKVIDREKDLEKLNRQALKIAKEVADEYNLLMAGNISNTWVYNPNDPKSHEEVKKIFEEQVIWAKEEGADFIIAETIGYLGEALIALEVIKKHNLTAVITMVPLKDTTNEGVEWDKAAQELEKNGADVVGLNCGRGPKTMLPILKKIKSSVSIPVAAMPVPFRTTQKCKNFQNLRCKDGSRAFPLNLEQFMMNRNEIAEYTKQAVQIGIDYIGLCCGAQTYQIRSIAETLGRKTVASRFSPNMEKHAVLGKITKEYEKENLEAWK